MSNTPKGSFRPNYRDEACMQFTNADQAVLDRIATEERKASVSKFEDLVKVKSE